MRLSNYNKTLKLRHHSPSIIYISWFEAEWPIESMAACSPTMTSSRDDGGALAGFRLSTLPRTPWDLQIVWSWWAPTGKARHPHGPTTSCTIHPPPKRTAPSAAQPRPPDRSGRAQPRRRTLPRRRPGYGRSCRGPSWAASRTSLACGVHTWSTPQRAWTSLGSKLSQCTKATCPGIGSHGSTPF